MRPIDYFDTAAEAHGRRIAVVDGGEHLSFAELQRLSDAIGGALASLAGPGSPVPIAILSPNDYRVIACTLGIMRAGHCVAPVHTRNSVDEIEAYLVRTSPACVFYHSTLGEQVRQIREKLGREVVWVCLDSDSGPDPSLDRFLGRRTAPVPDWGGVREDSERPVYIRQTSGTTGPPKLVIDDIQSFNASNQVLRYVLRAGDDGDSVFLAVAPLSHACGVFAFSMLTLGATVVVMHSFDVAEVFRQIRRHRVTHIWLPPTVLSLLLDAPEAKAPDWAPLRCLALGASAASPDRLREAVETFGPCVSLNYSQIESGFLTWLDATTIAAAVAGHHPERLASSGRSLFVGRVAIMDEAGRLLKRGETGEIVVRGGSVKNYQDPRETAEARRQGWHHTGDLGYLDDAGYLYVTGREKDIIISGGFKISAAEVERVIMERPEVGDCAVIAVPDKFRGEAVLAVVAVKPGHSLRTDEIVDHCRSRLGSSRSPRAIEQWAELPRTAVGKIDKRRIREKFWSTAPRQVD